MRSSGVFRKTEGQGSLFEAKSLLSEPQKKRLEESWAGPFREKVLPLLLEAEERFAVLYGEEGRPNFSVARLLGISLLQEMEKLPDQKALDAYSFDRRWQHALAVSADEAYVTRRTLVDFRRRVVGHPDDLVREVFDRVFEAAAADLNVSTSKQRLDSTLVTSAVRARGRIGVARETIRVFVRSLSELDRQRVPAAVRAWADADPNRWDDDVSPDDRTSTLHELGRWVRALLDAFRERPDVSSGAPYQHLERLAQEHGHSLGLDEDGPPEEPPPAAEADAQRRARNRRKAKKRRKNKGKRKASSAPKARFWSPHDPDASFGHKGFGYHVHIAETCGNERTELLTDYDVVTAARSDVGLALPAFERLSACDRAPETLYADGGYTTPDQLLQFREHGAELKAPIDRGRLAASALSRAAFEVDQDQVMRCPAGHEPTRHDLRAGRHGRPPSLHAFFDADTCRACPKRGSCPVRGPNNAKSREFRIDMDPALVARDARWEEQKTEEFRRDYAIRSGVEASVSELKRGHELGRLRVRGTPRVTLAVGLKVTACNIKRWLRQPTDAEAPPEITASAVASAKNSENEAASRLAMAA